MNTFVLAKSGGSLSQSLRELWGGRLGVVAALFTVLLFLAGCGGTSKTATPTPAFTPAAGTYTATQQVTVSDTNQSSVLYCTNDGSAPTASSPQCANPIAVSQSQTLRAIAIAPGMSASAIASAAYVINATAAAPTITAIAPTTGSSAGNTSVTILGTNFTGVTAVNFGTNQAASFKVISSTSISAVSPAGSGSVHITVIAAGGTSATTSADLFSYGTAPAITGLSPAAATVGSAAITLTVNGNNFTSDAVVKWNGATLTTTYVSGTQLTATVPASLLAATGTATVTVAEAGGVSSGVAFAINAAAPSIVGISPSQGPSAGGTTVSITGTNFTGVTAVKFGAASALSYSLISPNSITAVSPVGSAGTVDIQVVTPSGGSATGPADQFTYVGLPTVTAISPSTGRLAGGTAVTISGFNLAQASSVIFGSTAAAGYQVNSSTSITAQSPQGSAGTVDIRVVTPGGESVMNGADQFTYTSAPTVTGVTPSAGPVAGGTSVTVTGENFVSGATTVYFNGNPATNVSVNADGSSLSATSPQGSAGTVDITVSTPGGASSTNPPVLFTYAPAPTVTGVSPAIGSTGGGTVVTITGTNFSGTGYTVTAVDFGGVPATDIKVNSATSVSATSPVGSTGAVDVVVVTQGGSSAPNPSGDQFTYGPPPAVESITPTQGPTTGNTQVTITGTGFSGATAVNFGTVAGTGLTLNSPTSISITSPMGSPGIVDVTVTTPYGTSATGTGDQFTYVTTLSGVVISGPNTGTATPIKANVQLYAAGTGGYGTGATPILSTPVATNATTGAFSFPYDCSTLTAPGDQLYLVATGATNTDAVMMTALGSCANIATAYPNGVTVNEATTVASAFALSGFASMGTSGGIDVGAPTSGTSCNATAGWKSTGDSTCNYIGLQNAFATVNNLVDIPSGQVLAITPAYCTAAPCVTATTSNTTPYYATSIVPQGRINAMANALSACVNPATASANCGTLLTATAIGASIIDVSCASANLYTPADTLQATLSIARFPGDRTDTSCGVDVVSGSGILSLIPATNPPYTPTLTSSTLGADDLSLALIYQGGGLGRYSSGSPATTGLAIDASGNIWVPTESSTGGSVAVFNNQGAPITAAGNANGFGGYTTGVYNPQSIAIDQNGNAWIGNSPTNGNHSRSDYGSLSEIQLSGSKLTTLQNELNGGTGLLTPSQYGLAIDASNNVWVSSNPGVGGLSQYGCTGGSHGGGILEFSSSSGQLLNGPNGILSYSDNSSCPTTLAFDQSGLLWTWDGGTSGTDPNIQSLVQLAPSSGAVAGGPYNTALQNPSYQGNNFCPYASDTPSTDGNMAIDSLGDSWFATVTGGDANCMYVIPNMTATNASAAISQGTWGWALSPISFNVDVNGPTVIDGGDNAWANSNSGGAYYLTGYNSENASSTYEATATDTALLAPQPGFNATDPSANASGRTGGTDALSAQGTLGVDASGNLWVSSGSQYGNNDQLTEFIGLAVPAQTPLATALTNSTNGKGGLGVKP